MIRIRYHREARVELRQAVYRGEDERSGRGVALEAAVEKVLRRLRRFPESAPLWPTQEWPHSVRRALVQKTPYVVVYAVFQDELIVIALAHTRQEPGYWNERLEDVES